jgi:hypothetical protein
MQTILICKVPVLYYLSFWLNTGGYGATYYDKEFATKYQPKIVAYHIYIQESGYRIDIKSYDSRFGY